MKRMVIMVSLLIPLTFISCKKIEYIDNQPQLEIKVVNINGAAVSNATVTLYNTEGDWKTLSNPVVSQQTDDQGDALFKNLEEQVYYFYASKDSLNNKESISMLNDSLQVNVRAEITTVIK